MKRERRHYRGNLSIPPHGLRQDPGEDDGKEGEPGGSDRGVSGREGAHCVVDLERLWLRGEGTQTEAVHLATSPSFPMVP